MDMDGRIMLENDVGGSWGRGDGRDIDIGVVRRVSE